MTRDIIITVTGISLDEAGHETTTALTARGQYFLRNGARFLLYNERDPETGSFTKNLLKLTDSSLELSRSGALRCRLIFETGKTHRASYTTPCGSLLLDICTEELNARWSDCEGTIRLVYSLLEGSSLLSRNKLSVKIKDFSEPA